MDKFTLKEALKPFKGKAGTTSKDYKETKNVAGEGREMPNAFGAFGVGGDHNAFFNNQINKKIESEIARIQEYRKMAQMPEVADVIEDACNESLQTDDDDRTLRFKIIDDEISNNQNILKNLNNEFDKLFYNRLDINNKLWDLLRTYYIDGRVYYERIINEKKPKEGILNIKKLPTETMDFEYDRNTGKILAYYQYKSAKALSGFAIGKRPLPDDVQDQKNLDYIVFYPSQIGFIHSGMFGASRREILGYLEKVRIPYNQLKMLETSVVIYRLVRSPERFVFKIDTGNMPADKAMKFVEKIKASMTKKQAFDPSTGRLTSSSEIVSLLENYYIPVNQDGRGSDIETIGGNGTGFTELDDIYYFSRKLYRALKYPKSRVSAMEEKRSGDIVYGGQSWGEISRDEIKWAKFLEKQSDRFCDEMTNLFLLHLEFIGLKQQYGLNKASFRCYLDPPNNYKAQMDQKNIEAKFNNFNSLSTDNRFTFAFLLKKYLGWDEEEIEEMYKMKKWEAEIKEKYKVKEDNEEENNF